MLYNPLAIVHQIKCFLLLVEHQKLMEKQLEHLVGQSERYSCMLASKITTTKPVRSLVLTHPGGTKSF